MPKIAILPKDDKTNGWSRILPPRSPKPALEGEVRADWIVVGAGFAGLAAARRLAENRPNDKILLLEAQEVGEGASGRNSGFAIDLPHNVGSSMQELTGSHRFMRLSRAAIAALDRAVSEGGIPCDWSPRGKYHAAVSPYGEEKVLAPFAKELEALGEPYRWLDRASLAREIGTSYHHAAIHTPGGMLMNPAALTRGLAGTLPAAVTLHEHTPVVATRYGNDVTVETPEGSASAPAMILAVNGFAGQFGFFRGRLLNFAGYGSLSRRLTADERAALGGEDDWGLTPANAFAGVTMRFTRDHRLLIRQHFAYAPGFRRAEDEPQRVRRHHQALFDARFPMLPEVTIEHTWKGHVCLSRNHAPGFGRVAPNVYAAVCQNAVGVTKGTIGGLLAADMATGQDNPLIADMESLGAPSKLLPGPLLDIGVPAMMAAEIWRARTER